MSAVPGSLFRRILFWAHLSCGVTAGLIILLMSATGVLLAYEHQLVDSASRSNYLRTLPTTSRLTADELAAAARAQTEGGARLNLVFDADPAAPVAVGAGRETAALLNPYTGEKIADGAAGRREFFSTVERLHRWMGGDARSKAANLIDIANLMFLFLIVSGIYIWFPDVWRWRTFRGLLLFKSKYINGKVRDFNWHHVFSAWALVPLFLIAFSGVVMSYPWANKLVYAAFGEEAPQRGNGGGGPPGMGPRQGTRERNRDRDRDRQVGNTPGGNNGQKPEADATSGARASLQQLLDASMAQEGNWQYITLPLQLRGNQVDVAVELKSTERRAPRRTLQLSTADASVISAPPQAAAVQSPGQRARSWLRMVHTGEQYGIVGQTIAALASFAACFLVYTGLALAWRRLIVPLYRGRAA